MLVLKDLCIFIINICFRQCRRGFIEKHWDEMKKLPDAEALRNKETSSVAVYNGKSCQKVEEPQIVTAEFPNKYNSELDNKVYTLFVNKGNVFTINNGNNFDMKMYFK